MQSFEEYRKVFLEDTLSTEESEANGTVASFVKICAGKLFDGDVMPEYTPCYYQGTGFRNALIHVDGYAYDDKDGAFYILTALYSGAPESITLLGSDAKTALDRCRLFAVNAVEHDLESKIEISTEAYDLAALIKDQARFISRFVVILLTDMSLSERANLTELEPAGKGKKKKSKRTGVLDAEPIRDIDVEYRIWDMPRFYRMFAIGDGKDAVEIDFLQYSKEGIPCLPANNGSKDGCMSYLCTVPGDIIADLYDEYGSRILEGNVRSFLGRKGSKKSVNNQIRSTVLNQPDRFFVYNNGLATTATEVRVERGRLVYAKDLQIVNGGQTTASLATTRKLDGADLSRVSVLMKLTQVPSDVAAEMVPLISKSANSQNQIKPADFFSTHEYHIRMEQISRRKFAPAKDGAQHETHWFYERARGQYIQATMLLTKSEERKFITQNPKEQVITKTDWAKVLNSWNEFPHVVSKGAEANFNDFAERTEQEWEAHKDDFNDDYFQNAIALTIMFRTIDKLIPKQTWYSGGYKANVVAYTMSLLHHKIKEWYPEQELDLQRIWQKQKCPDILVQQLTILAEKVYYSITAPTRSVENVTQWCKQPACWDAVKHISCAPVAKLDSLLCGHEAIIESKREARKIRQIDDDVDNMTLVLKLGAEYWKRLSVWLRSHRLASDGENKALKVAVKISEGKFPDEKQCKSLLKLRKKAVDEGFPPK